MDTTVDFSAPFTDADIVDTHSAVWNWDDGNTFYQSDVVSPAQASHAYSEAGIYKVSLTITDSYDLYDTETYEFVVVYDPNAGFVTGGGWIDSPEGAYKPDPTLTGKGNFGFVSKYKRGAKIPTGNTEFQVHAGDLNFHSSNYDWLLVTGKNYARFKGEGTINGMPDPYGLPYKFILWAGDGTGTDGIDTFRIKIWWEDSEDNEYVVYDNGFDGSGYENGQPIGAGSIVVHTKK